MRLNVKRLKVCVAQSCPTLCDSMDCSLPGSSVHGIFQARVPEWVAIPCSRGSSLVVQTVKNLLAMQETWVHSMRLNGVLLKDCGWEDFPSHWGQKILLSSGKCSRSTWPHRVQKALDKTNFPWENIRMASDGPCSLYFRSFKCFIDMISSIYSRHELICGLPFCHW